MKNNKVYLIAGILVLIGIFSLAALRTKNSESDLRILSYEIDPTHLDLQFYWQNENYTAFRSIQNLKIWLEKRNKKLIFAMNGGMFNPDRSPKGLFIQEQKTLIPLDTSKGSGNFYLKPNGIFYITTENQPGISKTNSFVDNGKIRFATQSGPMLLIDGDIHSIFKKGSNNLHIRNGVGILSDNKIVFAMSKQEINFYDFAKYFKDLGCKNALYLDGFVSRTYLPEKNWIQTDGDFGAIIAVTANK